MPPFIVTCASTGEYRKQDHPGIPASAEEQAEAAQRAFRGRGAESSTSTGATRAIPDKSSNDPARYREINELIRAARRPRSSSTTPRRSPRSPSSQ